MKERKTTGDCRSDIVKKSAAVKAGSGKRESAGEQGTVKRPEFSETPAPHDKGYKKSLSKPAEFLHFLKKYVKADWMMQLREADLILCDKEMLEHDYEGKEADLIYRVNTPDGKQAFIFILQELQSYVDYTMIFRILVYVVNTLVKYFMDVDKKEREKAGFRLPAMVPIVFYNGSDRWTAVTSMCDYQNSGEMFGDYILNLKYYLVDLAKLEEEYILSTNTVLDNIMYCDKFRKRMELVGAIRTAYGRVRGLGLQEREEFRNWVKYILLSVCENKEAVAEEILSWAGDRESDMAFEYTIIRSLKEEREEMRAEVKEEVKAEVKEEVKAATKTEDILTLLAEIGTVSDTLKQTICTQKDLAVLTQWVKTAARAETIEEFEGKICDTGKRS